MPQLIDFKTPYRQIQREETQKYRDILLSEGMEEITPQELISKLANLGYKIDHSMCHNYYNNMNKHNYLAKSIHYTDIKSKQSYAHYEQAFTNANNLEQLQKIRRNCFIYSQGRIWDL